MDKAVYRFKAFFGGILREIRSLGQNVKTYVIYGVLYDTMLNLYKPYAAKFAERLGATELDISLVTSLPGVFAVLALVPCSVFLARIKDKQKVTAVFFAVSRAFLPLMALTPLLPANIRAVAFVIVLSAMNFPDAVSQASLQSFLGDLFLPRKRADAIAVRSKFGNMATTASLIISCLILNYAVSTNEQKIVIYQIFFIIAFLFGIAEIYAFMKLKPGRKPALAPASAPSFNFSASFAKIIRDKKFTTYCLVSFAFHFVYFMGFPLSNIVQIKVLSSSELWVGIAAIASVAAIVFSSTFWGRMLVKRGTGTVLTLSSLGLAVNCFLMGVSPNQVVFAATNLFSGCFNCGVTLGVLNGLLEATPDEDRVVYVGVFQTFVNLTLAVSPLFAHFVNSVTGIYPALAITAALRTICGIAIFFIYRSKPSEA